MPENQITTDFRHKVNSWKNLCKFWNDPLCTNRSGLFCLHNVAAYWKSSNTEACAKKLSQILANNIDNWGGVGAGGGGEDWSHNFCQVLHTVTWHFDHAALRNNEAVKSYNSTSRMPMATKLERIVTYRWWVPTHNSLDILIALTLEDHVMY